VREVFVQVFQNLRANKLRSFLTMFGILWGIISVVVLGATGEGFQRGNQKVLEELGKNVGILWGGRTSQQAGGERAGRQILLTVDDARALATESSMIAVVSPELQRNLSVRSAFNSASLNVHGIEPQYQAIRTIDIERGRMFRFTDEENALRVAIVGADATAQLFGTRESLGQTIYINGLPFTVIAKIRKKDQDSNYSGPDNDKVFVPFSAMARDFPRPDADPGVVSNIIVTPQPWVIAQLTDVLNKRTGRIEDIDWPLEREIRRVLAPRHRFDPTDRNAVAMWDTTLQTLMFGRMNRAYEAVLHRRGHRDALARRARRDEHHAGRGARAHAGNRRAQGARRHDRQRAAPVLPRGLHLTMLSGMVGFVVALGLCSLVNLLPMPTRFSGMVITPAAGLAAVAALTFIGVITSTYPARRAALMPPVEALRYEGH
jgi:putative ABC transport system permease protein